MDQYYLSNVPERTLMAQHFHSSLDEPNLDNVEAKLYVARQRNHQLAMEYFKNKYGSTAVYEQFARTHQLGEIPTAPSKQEQLRRHLDRKALEIANYFKAHPEAKEIKIQQDQINKPFLRSQQNRAPARRSSNNPWVNDKNTSNDRIENELAEKVIVDSVGAYHQRKESQFVNEFRNYLANKNKGNLDNSMTQSKFAKTFESNPSLKPSQQFVKQPQPSVKKQVKKIKSYEQELARKIFRDILQEPFSEQSTVEKITLIEYLVQNSKIIKVLGLTEQSLNEKLIGEHPTQFQSTISFQQFLFFLLKTVGKQKEINQIKQKKRDMSIPPGCMLSLETINRFQAIFKKLDTHTDLIVKRMQFTEMLAQDPVIKKLLNTPAVYEQSIDKRVSLRRIFQRIQIQLLFGSEEDKKAKEYISWNEFLSYLRSESRDRSKYDLMLLVDTIRKQDKFGLMEVPEIVLDLIISSCNSTKRQYEQFFNTADVLNAICKNPQYESEKYSLVRQQSRISKLPSETFEEVLKRIKNTAPQYTTIKQLLEFFSARGKPVENFEQNQDQSTRKNFSGVKVKFIEQAIMEKSQINPDGYDSDPQTYHNNSQLARNSPRRSGRSSKKLETAKSFYQDEQQLKLEKKELKITVPQPFSFEQRQKSRTRNKSVQNHSQSSKQYQPFRAKQVPPSVLEVGLLDRKNEQERRKAQERKKNSMIITLASERPFSFLNRKTKKKTKQERQQYQFKAKPIPWYCSVELLEKKKENEIVRNQKIAKQAQQSLAKAKLPPRMERDYQQKLAKEAMAEQKKEKVQPSTTFVYRDPPDFDRLHREFEEGMERKRKQNKTTKPEEFNFNQRPNSRPKTAVFENAQNIFSQSVQKSKFHDPEAYRKNFAPKQVAGTTLKFTQQAEKRRNEMQEKRKKQENLLKEEEERKHIDQQLKNKVIALAKNKQNDEKKKREKVNEQMKEQTKAFKSWKKQCIQKGRQQPMLVERPLKRDEKIQKMKKLYQISKTLKQNGIKGKDHDSYFKREELLLLQDWELLKDKLS